MNERAAAPRLAGAVQWLGPCSCGCGLFKAAILDEDGEPFAMFGFDRDGWINFMKGVLELLDEGEDGEHHTTH